MYIFHLNLKKISLWILLLGQMFIILIYFYSQLKPYRKTPENGVNFIKNEDYITDTRTTYHTLKSNIILKTVSTRESYIDFNSSLCFKNGTDLKSMKVSGGVNWKCTCLPGWHGNDCGLPEVMWRAVLTSKKPYKIKGPRTFERRLIYLFKVNKFSEYLADMRINDLGTLVDLFILYEDDNESFLQKKLDNKFCKEYQHKILYVQNDGENLWKRVKNYLKNIRNDDIILSSDLYELPNKDALIFLKFHDHWPQPIKFRYRWSVFGFFWKHPEKTITGGGACTVSFLKESFNNEITFLSNNKTYKGLMLGDLNHYGGWYCEYCNDPATIVEFLSNKPKNVINWDKIDHQKIDSSYIEDLIENGVYIDGKTGLTRAHKYHDNYFAPQFVLEYNWKYDFLLINFYSKADYYDI